VIGSGDNPGGVDEVHLGSGNDGAGGIGHRAIKSRSGRWWWRGGVEGECGARRHKAESQGKKAHEWNLLGEIEAMRSRARKKVELRTIVLRGRMNLSGRGIRNGNPRLRKLLVNWMNPL
jgi:hypothetical protein